MLKFCLFLWVIFGFVLAPLPPADVPQAEISNGLIRAKLYLPDPKKGYYQGTRFDWSGVIYSLEYKGHEYFGQWFDQYDPKIHDAITGPVEEFVPIGYDEGQVGDPFLKIGVGVLRKPEEESYRFSRLYEVVEPGTWKSRKKADRVEFTHELKGPDGYAYLYKKTVRLVKGKPELVLEHTLQNTGKKRISTTAYNHNFFVIDQAPTGPDIRTRFAYDVEAEGQGFGTLAEVRDRQLIYLRELQKGENIYTPGIRGFGPTAKDYHLDIQNLKTGAGVKITSDQPLDKLVFWASSRTSCPEPYIQVQAAPGEEFSWQITYAFYTGPAAAAQ
ncbi:hypothetical protein BH24BAC1_BH24BAC1_35580 [soil metagenome]